MTSPLVAAATARRPTRWWVAVVMTVVFYYVGFAVVYLVGKPWGSDADEGYAPFVWAGLAFGAIAGLLFLWVRLKEGRPVRTAGFMGSGLLRLGAGVLLGVVLSLVLVGLALVLGQVETVEAPSGSAVGSSALVGGSAMLLIWLVQGSAEEIVYRGYLLPVLAQRLPLVAAVLLSSAMWMSNHATEPGFDLVVLLNMLIWGSFFCLIALRQGSIWLVCGIHAGWNWTEGNLIGFDMSGMTSPAALVFMGPTDDVDDRVLNVDYGLEGGLMATAYFLVLLAIGFAYYRRGRTVASRRDVDQTSA